jgi:hypothetical protein
VANSYTEVISVGRSIFVYGPYSSLASGRIGNDKPCDAAYADFADSLKRMAIRPRLVAAMIAASRTSHTSWNLAVDVICARIAFGTP